MFRCLSCHHSFNDFQYKKEEIGECAGTPAFECHAVCPECGSDDWDEAEYCDECGELFGNCELEFCENGQVLCENCRKDKEEEPCRTFQAGCRAMLKRIAM